MPLSARRYRRSPMMNKSICLKNELTDAAVMGEVREDLKIGGVYSGSLIDISNLACRKTLIAPNGHECVIVAGGKLWSHIC